VADQEHKVYTVYDLTRQ